MRKRFANGVKTLLRQGANPLVGRLRLHQAHAISPVRQVRPPQLLRVVLPITDRAQVVLAWTLVKRQVPTARARPSRHPGIMTKHGPAPFRTCRVPRDGELGTHPVSPLLRSAMLPPAPCIPRHGGGWKCRGQRAATTSGRGQGRPLLRIRRTSATRRFTLRRRRSGKRVSPPQQVYLNPAARPVAVPSQR